MNITNKYFIRTKGKAEFKTYHLINTETFDMLDNYFSSEKEAKKYAVKNSIEIVEFVETFENETNEK
jgi:hypothetical protein